MMRCFAIWFCGMIVFALKAQNPSCNSLGVWLWYLEQTGFSSHDQLAERLQQLGVKRIYVKVADGKVDTVRWKELVDTKLVQSYRQRAIEVWAWSYNYPQNDSLQAAALTLAAKTGYMGYVVDVEKEFDGDSFYLEKLFSSFSNAKKNAIDMKIAPASFKLYCTTWGNPIDHRFRLDVINPHVDAFMPQTYVENWGQSYLNNLEYWIDVGNREYAQLGVTKPIHHIVSTEKGIISAQQINQFILKSGAETSIWRIPGGGVSMSIWDTWANVNWNVNFCQPLSVEKDLHNQVRIFPNPFTDFMEIASPSLNATCLIRIFTLEGKMVLTTSRLGKIGTSHLPSGVYVVKIEMNDSLYVVKVVKP